MANFPGMVMNPGRRRTPTVDGGTITKRERVGIQRGQSAVPYNINMRGLRQRVDVTKL